MAIEQFPNKKIPRSLQKLQKKYKERFEILFCDDLKSYKKLIPSLLIFKNHPIITADDDVYYAQDWLKSLWESYQDDPKAIHAHSVYQVSLSPYPTWKEITNHNTDLKHIGIGVGGILYPPNCLHKDIFDTKTFQELAPIADDLYFWSMAVLNNTKTKLVEGSLGHPESILNLWDSPNLWEQNCGKNLNDIQFENILKTYPSIKALLINPTALD